MADFGLADAVDAPKSLFQTIWIPGQVVVDHQMRPLQVDSFASRIGSQENEYVFVLLKGFLGLGPIFPPHSSVNCHESFRHDDRSKFFTQIVQGVAMFGEDDQLATMAVGIEHLRMILQQPGELFPFLVRSAATNLQG